MSLEYDPWFFIPMATLVYVILTCQFHVILCFWIKKYKHHQVERQRYILHNLMKSGMLLYLSIVCIYHFEKIIRISEWNNHRTILLNFSGLYTITDVIGTIIVFQKMQFKTIIHHIGVYSAFISIVLEVFPIDSYDYVHSIVIYGIYSSFAFSVNTYLALFHLKKDTRMLCNVSLNVYIVVCFVNWLTQFYILCHLLYNYDLISAIVLVVLLFAWIPDDISLMKAMKLRKTQLYNEKEYISKKDKIRIEMQNKYNEALNLFQKIFYQIRNIDNQNDLYLIGEYISNGYKNSNNKLSSTYFGILNSINDMQFDIIYRKEIEKEKEKEDEKEEEIENDDMEEEVEIEHENEKEKEYKF